MQLSIPKFEVTNGIGDDDFNSFSRNGYLVIKKPFDMAPIEISGIKKQSLCIEKGNMLIWSANLLHGGDPILKHDSTRFSQVTHYYFEACKYYTPLGSDFMNGRIEYRNNIANIANA